MKKQMMIIDEYTFTMERAYGVTLLCTGGLAST